MSHSQKLQKYVELLLKWNKKINLVGKSTESDIFKRHIEDSLQLKEYIGGNDIIIDFGAGAGLPGIPLAIAANLPLIAVESDNRKSVFLSEAMRVLEINGEVLNSRIEVAKSQKFDLKRSEPLLTSRALADLENFFKITNSFLANNQIQQYTFLILKGKNVSRETVEAKKSWDWNEKSYPSITENGAVVLQITDLKATN